jgi:molybdate transport system ATP-binding protein
MSTIDARFKGRLGSFALDVAFTLSATGVTGLFGPSGCGKTTVLRCLAGLTQLKDGRLTVDGAVWQDAGRFLAPHERPVGYVFQEPRLFAHLSVLGNLNYGRRRSRAAPAIVLDQVVDLLGIGHLLDRAPKHLSGGESQRVALGRALLAQPRLMLMDEPLSALDRESKQEILPYLETLSARLSLPIIYVSHDISEIERLADHLLVMTREGRIEAAGRLDALLTDLSLSLARAPESAAVLMVTLEGYDEAYGLNLCAVDGLTLLVPGPRGPQGAARRLRVRAGDVSLVKSVPQGTSILNILPARLLSAEPARANQMLVLLGLAGRTGEARLLSSITRKSWDELNLAPGEAIFAQIKGMALADKD